MKVSAPFFVSYARRDADEVDRLRRVMLPLMKASAEFAFGEWMDRQILPGQGWRTEIEAGLAGARFGLLLVSPEFLASDFIQEHEAPALLAKPVLVPVALHEVHFDGSMALNGLHERQVFHDSRRRCFDACRTGRDRRVFARELFAGITALLRGQAC